MLSSTQFVCVYYIILTLKKQNWNAYLSADVIFVCFEFCQNGARNVLSEKLFLTCVKLLTCLIPLFWYFYLIKNRYQAQYSLRTYGIFRWKEKGVAICNRNLTTIKCKSVFFIFILSQKKILLPIQFFNNFSPRYQCWKPKCSRQLYIWKRLNTIWTNWIQSHFQRLVKLFWDANLLNFSVDIPFYLSTKETGFMSQWHLHFSERIGLYLKLPSINWTRNTIYIV